MHTENPCLPASVRRRNHRRYSLYRNLSGTALYPEWLCPLLLVQRQPGGSSLFTVQKQSFYCHRLPHHPTSEVQEPYAAEYIFSLSCTHANVFNLCRRLQAKRSLSDCAFICGILHIERGRYNRQKQTPAGSSSRFHIFGNEEKTSSAISL